MLRFSKVAALLAIVVGLMVAFSSSVALAWSGAFNVACKAGDKVVVDFNGETGGPTSGTLDFYTVDEKGHVSAQPVAHEPWKIVKGDDAIATFPLSDLSKYGLHFKVVFDADKSAKIDGQIFELECGKTTPSPSPSSSPSLSPSPSPSMAPPGGGSGGGTPPAQTGSGFVVTGLFGLGFLFAGLGIWFYRGRLLRLVFQTRNLIS